MGNVRAKAEKLFSSYFTGEFSLKQPLPSSFIQYKFTKVDYLKMNLLQCTHSLRDLDGNDFYNIWKCLNTADSIWCASKKGKFLVFLH